MTKRQLAHLERDNVLQPLLQPSVVEIDGVRWFDIESLRRLSVSLRRIPAVEPTEARSIARRPPGVQRVTGAETRQIFQWFKEDRAHADIVMRSGKTAETIRYLHQQYITPSGARLRATPPAPSAPEYEPELPDYFPEREPAGRGRPRRDPPGPIPGPTIAKAAPARAPADTPSARAAAVASSRSAPLPGHPKRTLTQVPDSWFTDPLPPLPEEDDDD